MRWPHSLLGCQWMLLLLALSLMMEGLPSIPS